MQAQQAPMIFSEAERQAGDRLLKLALETDRVEGYTEPHAVMIARLAEAIGREMGLHGTDLSSLKFAALAHDIGERGMKRNYLLGTSALTWEERLDSWRHPILGEQAAAEMRFSRQTQLLIRWHHEWWNGQGYPDGLSGEAIPLGARILRAVDSYCALISARPYRQAFELIEAEQTISDLAGIEFDPQVAKLLLMLVAEERRQREAEIELREQQNAVWNIPPQFDLHTGYETEEELERDLAPAAKTLLTEESLEELPEKPPEELSVELPEESVISASLSSETMKSVGQVGNLSYPISEEIKDTPTAAAYEPVLTFAESEPDEVGNQVMPDDLRDELQDEITSEVPSVEITPPHQMPTMEFPVIELPKQTNLQTEQIQNTEAELDENSGATESAPKIQI